MNKVLNPTILMLALELAAKILYQHEVVDPEMEDIIIGDDGEYPTAEEWVSGRIQSLIETVGEKFKMFHQAGKFEISEKTIASAYMFYKLTVGESININKNVMITRVPGGWVWQSLGHPCSNTFIPYSDEFLSVIQGEVDQ